MERRLIHDAVRFPKTGDNAFGRPTFGAPEDIKVRWVTIESEFLDQQNNKQVSSAVVYLPQTLDIRHGDYLLQGTVAGLPGGFTPDTDLVGLEGAFPVRGKRSVDYLSGGKVARKAFL